MKTKIPLKTLRKTKKNRNRTKLLWTMTISTVAAFRVSTCMYVCMVRLYLHVCMYVNMHMNQICYDKIKCCPHLNTSCWRPSVSNKLRGYQLNKYSSKSPFCERGEQLQHKESHKDKIMNWWQLVGLQYLTNAKLSFSQTFQLCHNVFTPVPTINFNTHTHAGC